MGRKAPLDPPELRAIELQLDELALDEAQRMLAKVGDRPNWEHGVTYLAARLLFLKGRLDARGLAERLRELVGRAGYFPEAAALLHEAEHGHLTDTASDAPPSEPVGTRAEYLSPAPEPPKSGPEKPARDAPGALPPLGPLPDLGGAERGTEAPSDVWPASAPAEFEGSDSAWQPLSEESDDFGAPPEWQPEPPAEPPGAVFSSPPEPEPAPPSGRTVPGPFSTASTASPFSPVPPPEEPPRASPSSGDAFTAADRRLPANPDPPSPAAAAHPGSTPPPTSRRPGEWPQAVWARHKRHYTPIGGLAAYRETEPAREPPAHAAIPRAPMLPEFEEPVPDTPPDPEKLDPIRSRSLLPRGAGRYSEHPSGEERVESARPGRKAPRPNPRAPVRGASAARHSRGQPYAVQEIGPPDDASHDPRRDAAGRNRTRTPEPEIRSGLPPPSGRAGPALFELATWIDEGRYTDAIAAINRLGPGAGPEHVLLHARALAAAGFADQAFDALVRLEETPLVDPDLRASAARLFIELGEPERGLKEAAVALDAAPDGALVRLTFAIAAVRVSRRHHSAELLKQASRLLSQLGDTRLPNPSLTIALRACIQAEFDELNPALSTAQRALTLDPISQDALAAVAEAAAKLGREKEASRACKRLYDLAPAEAEALIAKLVDAGIPLSPRASSRPPRAATRTWSAEEEALDAGDRARAIVQLERMATDHLARMSKNASQSGMTALGTVAASFLSSAPVFRSFAPFDLSLHSVARVEACIDVLYGPTARPHVASDETAMLLLLGAYLGETLRLAYQGHWEGKVGNPEAARLLLGRRELRPVFIVTSRVQQGHRAAIRSALGVAVSDPSSAPWRSRISSPVTPAPLWSPRSWPAPGDMNHLAEALTHSAIGIYCRERGAALDLSIDSLDGLEGYVELVAPLGAPIDAGEPWIRELAVLLGAYVGEVLRIAVGGEWMHGGDQERAATEYLVRLRGHLEATPVATVLDRLTGRRNIVLHAYVEMLTQRGRRPPDG